MKRRRNMEFVAASEGQVSGGGGGPTPSELAKEGVIIDRPIDDPEFLFLLEPERGESDELVRLPGAD